MYLDPGFGSMVIQIVIALIAGFGAYAVIIRKKISAFIFRKKQNESSLEDDFGKGIKRKNERV